MRRALVALLLAAVAALVMSVLHGDGRYQEPEARAGRYYASKVTGERARVEVSMAVYGAVREGEQRMILSAASCVAALGVPAWHSPRGRCAGPTRAFRLV
ncbi:hypothetical protein [Streptomyces sp. 2231.1]|uniref:hypothetical protein n=1 Tax=Streptomyces sp. 2231.1 TaxID=1855347 RepID=UPI00115FE6B3|nr:hypothetical protein [Streptomyces sp. 2231.1]